MFFKTSNNRRNEICRKGNGSNQQSEEQKQSKDFIWIGIGILFIVLIEIYIGEGLISTGINRILQLLEKILP